MVPAPVGLPPLPPVPPAPPVAVAVFEGSELVALAVALPPLPPAPPVRPFPFASVPPVAPLVPLVPVSVSVAAEAGRALMHSAKLIAKSKSNCRARSPRPTMLASAPKTRRRQDTNDRELSGERKFRTIVLLILGIKVRDANRQARNKPSRRAEEGLPQKNAAAAAKGRRE